MGGDVTLGSLKRLTTVMAGQDIDSVDINGGAIDGAIIGAASAAAGTFTTLTATGGQVSSGIVALTATVALTSAANAGGRVNYITGTAAAAYTLPEATGTGDRYIFIIGQVNTNGGTVVAADTTNTSYHGTCNILDVDGTAQTGYFTATAGGTDTVTWNGTTQGGRIGDRWEFIDLATDVWHCHGELSVVAGSNIATPFSSAA